MDAAVTSYDILIPTIPHRHDQLCTLLAEIDRQWQPGLGVRILRDNLERPGIFSYAKWQDLLETSVADYVSWAGDDDMIAPGYVARVMAALEDGPDYVGFPVRFTLDGQPQQPVEHSLRHGCWDDWHGGIMVRDIVHTNPIRRELALLTSWGIDNPAEDLYWAARLRVTGRVKDEIWLNEPMYFYQASAASGFWAVRGPLPDSLIRKLPVYPWLTTMDVCTGLQA